MRCLARPIKLAALLGATATFIAALSLDIRAQKANVGESDELLGTWQLNVARSKYSPGPAPKSETRTYLRDAEGLKGTIRRVYRDGREEVIEYRADFNHEYPVSGTEAYDAVKFKRIDAHTAEAVLSHAGRVFGTARRIISEDGQTMTITFRRESADQALVNNTAIYTKAAK